jgi:hypothetical protein
VKKELLNELLGKMKEELHELEEAAQANKEFATDQEFKAESKYDTRSLEASYLASAEAFFRAATKPATSLNCLVEKK